MRFSLLCLLFTFLLGQTANAGTIETYTGDLLTGKIQLDFGGILFHPTNGPDVKMELGSVYRVQFDNAPSLEEFVPGIVLRNGLRLAAPWGPFNAPVIKIPNWKLSVPSEEIAWIVYTAFPTALAANVPAGQTGVLLPKGDFFAGTIRGADTDGAKVFNSVFGPRTFPASDIHALILRDARVPVAQYEVRTTDGSLFAADYLAPDRPGVTIKHSLYDNLLIGTAAITEIRAGASRCRPVTTFGALHAEPAEGLEILPDRGFNLATKSVASCVAPPGFTELRVKVAADESTPPDVRLVFSVSADGRTLARSSALSVADPAQNLRIPLSGVHNLVLRVDATGATTSALHGRWVQALFLRQ
ncbi:MAG TPA: NPCBM/NEW2 domain-containing protein [Chthoniobacter sp.]|jgi:hypothetical protein